MCDALPIIPFTKIPETNLVEVVQTNRLSNAVDENCIGYGCRNDIGKSDLEEVNALDDLIVVDVAYEHKDEKDRGESIQCDCKNPKEGWFWLRVANRDFALG